MSRPNKLKVGHRVYSIRWLDLAQWYGARLTEEADGLTFVATGEILIRTYGGDEGRNRTVLMHELLHVAFADSEGSPFLDEAKDKEEYAVALLAPRVLEILRTNPKVCRYLFGD